MLDVGNDDERYRQMVPDRPFWEIRRGDPDQRRYFLGEDMEGVGAEGTRVGAQLTPPRQFVTRDTDLYLPVSGNGFEPMQSLALGGLGAAWGAASFTYTDVELRRLGIHEPDFARHYDAVAATIGVSGEPADDASRNCFAGVEHAQPALDLDSVARCVWTTYHAHRSRFLGRGFALGRTPLAMLSRDLGERRANPYFDMDFWGDSRRSIFRPRYLLEELEKHTHFRLERRQLVLGFESAGAINSARIALASLGLTNVAVPLLCNPYLYMPCIALRMLGRKAMDGRHSLSQLVAIWAPRDEPDDVVSAQIYAYRSLLLFKLVKEIPLPAWAGLQIARLVMSSLAIVGVHHSDAPHPGKTLRIAARTNFDLPEVRIEFQPSELETALRRRRERMLARELLRLGVVPFARLSPGLASSIHYAGTLPVRAGPDLPYASRRDGRLWGAPRVYVGDSASWGFLPAKGPTYTIMANARRVAEHVLRDLEFAA